MAIFNRLFKDKKINDGLNTPTKIYLESYGARGAEVHFKRGEEALARNDLEKALLEFKYAVIAHPEHKGALRYLRGERLGPLNVKRTTNAQSLFDEGMALLERKEYEKAISCFDKAINLCPIAAVASFCFRGKAFLATGIYQEAIDDFSICLKYSPRVAEGYFDRGQAYLKLGKKSAAKKDLEMAIELNPGYVEARKMLGDLGKTSSSNDTRTQSIAFDEVKRALKEQEGDTAMLFVSNCLVSFGQGDYKEAMRHIDEGLAENPNHPKLLLWQGMVFFKEYKYKEAVEAFRKTLQADPDCEAAKDMLSCRELSIYSRVADRLRDI